MRVISSTWPAWAALLLWGGCGPDKTPNQGAQGGVVTKEASSPVPAPTLEVPPQDLPARVRPGESFDFQANLVVPPGGKPLYLVRYELRKKKTNFTSGTMSERSKRDVDGGESRSYLGKVKAPTEPGTYDVYFVATYMPRPGPSGKARGTDTAPKTYTSAPSRIQVRDDP